MVLVHTCKYLVASNPKAAIPIVLITVKLCCNNKQFTNFIGLLFIYSDKYQPPNAEKISRCQYFLKYRIDIISKLKTLISYITTSKVPSYVGDL